MIIALPLHLHAPAAIAAMKAGLHVITEKLMGHSVHECKEMARVAEQTKLLLATGHQRHYNILYDDAVGPDPQGLAGRTALRSAPSGTAATCRATIAGSSRCPSDAKPDDPQAQEAGQRPGKMVGHARSNSSGEQAASRRPSGKRRWLRSVPRWKTPSTPRSSATRTWRSRTPRARWFTVGRPSRN